MNEFKISLKACRINAELTQTEAGSKLGVTKETIMKWETGKVIPKAYQLDALSHLYNVPIENILLPDKSPLRVQNH